MDYHKYPRPIATLALVVMMPLFSGCGGDDGLSSEVVNVSVSDAATLCAYGVMAPQRFCPPGAFRLDTNARVTHSGSISGFEHEFGVAYELRIRITPIAEPLADGPDREYQLLETLDTTQVAEVGDTYDYELPLTGYIFEIIDGTYFIGPYAFECAEDVDCDQLIAMDGSEGIVNIELTYTGDAIPITLTFWN